MNEINPESKKSINFEVEENAPKLFEDKNENIKIEALDESDSDKLFNQDTLEEDDFEIPAFLRKQKF